MDYELVLKSARIDDEKPLVDIGIESGKVVKIGNNLKGQREIDLGGDVVTPTFFESHIHMVKALLDKVKPNLEGTLAGAISITGISNMMRYEEELKRYLICS